MATEINVYRNRYGNLGYDGVEKNIPSPLHAMESGFRDPTDPKFIERLRGVVYDNHDRPVAEVVSRNISTGKGGRQRALSEEELRALKERLNS